MDLTEKERFWFDHVYKWQSSGLNQSSYCREHNIHPRCFSGYKKRFLSSSKASSASSSELKFKPVHIEKPKEIAKVEAKVNIELPIGIKLTVRNDSDISLAIKLVKELVSC